ncbi:histidine phosphatase family protein [Patescibacteria group bacterium]|nr:histidine phosphatase family protein [Patescibacteria group bacterium]
MPDEENNFCTIYLVRHGQAEGNAKGILMGHIDLPLTEKGKLQAREVGEKLKDIHFDAAYSSDLTRARQTAELILLERKLVIQTSRLIKERSYGVHEGKSREKYIKDTEEFHKNLEELIKAGQKVSKYPDGVESDDSISSRMITFIREIAVANPNKTILAVTHGGILRSFLIRIGFVKEEEFPLLGSLDNGAFVKLLSDGTDFVIKETSGVHIIHN